MRKKHRELASITQARTALEGILKIEIKEKVQQKNNAGVPVGPHSVNQAKLYHVVKSHSADDLAKMFEVPTATAERWQSGQERVPKAVYMCLAFEIRGELPASFGCFAGWRVVGDRFCSPADNAGLHISELEFINDYRSAMHVADKQSALIERLLRERDFYRRQCHFEARNAGWLIPFFAGKRKKQ